MPWTVRRSSDCPPAKPWGVFNAATGRKVACHASEESAKAQQAALYRQVHAGQLLGVEIARPGTWHLRSGSLEVTAEMLQDAAEYATLPGVRPAALKIGHDDPRFDGEPALGWLSNLRVEADDDSGPVLRGDLLDMPEWLVQAAPLHWPDRSMEGWRDVERDGRNYSMVVDGLALLGVNPPGMSSIRSLRDLPQALGIAASERLVASASQILAVSDKPWSSFTQADYSDGQWAKACVLHRKGQSGKGAHGLPVREPSGALNRNGVHAAAARISQVHAAPDEKKSAANALLRAYGQLHEDPPESLRRLAAAASTQEGAGMTPAELREALGLAADAPDEDVHRVLAGAGVRIAASDPTPPAPTPPSPQPAPAPAPTPTPQPASVTPPTPAPAPEPTQPESGLIRAAKDGVMVVDSSIIKALSERADRADAAFDLIKRSRKDQIIGEAIRAGKFPPSRREHWAALYDADPDGTEAQIDNLAEGLVPITAAGYAGMDDPNFEQSQAYSALYGEESARG